MKTYITFGQAHIHIINGKRFDHNCVASIECGSHNEGRDRAFELFGPKFCTSYYEDDFNFEEHLKYYPRGIISVVEKKDLKNIIFEFLQHTYLTPEELQETCIMASKMYEESKCT